MPEPVSCWRQMECSWDWGGWYGQFLAISANFRILESCFRTAVFRCCPLPGWFICEGLGGVAIAVGKGDSRIDGCDRVVSRTRLDRRADRGDPSVPGSQSWSCPGLVDSRQLD